MNESTDSGPVPELPRVPTGVPGLDEVTGGGFLRSGVYILQGTPGAGKTIMANQIAHRHAAAGGKVVYVTMLAESHARLLQHLRSFAFFDPDVLPERVYYVSAFNALRSGGLKGVVDLLRTEVRAHRAGILVLDGLVMAATAAGSEEELKLFVSDIQAFSTLTGSTTLLLASDDPDRRVSAEQTMVDGILLLREKAYGPRRERNLEVVKLRGSDTLRGNHTFRIDGDGIRVYPRLEAARRLGPDGGVTSECVSTGVPDLDRMFAIGGFGKGSVNVACGPSGSGKTTLALHFTAATPPGERTLWFGFYEAPEFLAQTARVQGIDKGGVLAGPQVDYHWFPFGENVLDELAYRLLDRVAALRPARVVIDGVGGFYAAASFPDRGGAFLTTLVNELRRMRSTTLITVEEQQPGTPRTLDTATMSALADTIVNCRVTHQELVRRFLWIGKCRISRCDLRVREAVMGPDGLQVPEQGGAVGA